MSIELFLKDPKRRNVMGEISSNGVQEADSQVTVDVCSSVLVPDCSVLCEGWWWLSGRVTDSWPEGLGVHCEVFKAYL